MTERTAPILLLTFVNALGGTLLIPVLPFVVRDLGQSDFVFALLIAAYTFDGSAEIDLTGELAISVTTADGQTASRSVTVLNGTVHTVDLQVADPVSP